MSPRHPDIQTSESTEWTIIQAGTVVNAQHHQKHQ